MKSPEFLSSGGDIMGISTSPCVIPKEASLMIPKKASFSDLTADIIPFTYVHSEGQNDTVSAGSTGSEAAAGSDEKTKEGQETAGEDSPAPIGEDPSHLLKDGTRILGTVNYKYNDYDLGNVNILFRQTQKTPFSTISGPDAYADSAQGREGSQSGQGSTAAAADSLPQKPDKSSTSYSAEKDSVSERLHGIRALFFGIIHTGAHGSIYLNVLILLPLVLAVSCVLCVFFYIHSLYEARKRKKRKRRAVQAGSQKNSNSSRAGTRTTASNRKRRVK